MNCQEFLRLHSEFLDERLAPEAAERCAVHVAACASCARYDRIVRRGQEAVRRLPGVPVSADFTVRLEQRMERDALSERAPAVGSGATVSLALAALLALAAWGPMLRGEEAVRVQTLAETGSWTGARSEPMLLPSPDWWQAPALGAGFDTMRSSEAAELAFPGPYSPLIVMPPVAAGRGGAMPVHLTLE